MVPWFSGDYGMRLSFVFKFYLVRVAVDDRMMLRGPFLSENYVIERSDVLELLQIGQRVARDLSLFRVSNLLIRASLS